MSKHHNAGKPGQVGCSVIYGGYKHRMKKRGLDFDLTKPEFRKLAEQFCFYCGKSPSNFMKGPYGPNGDWYYNGLDRVDSNRGYTKENTVSCCKRCNIAKNNQTSEEFFVQIKSIYELHELWKI